jgi:ABC-type metal ion transport system substrate-binding protein
MIKKALKGAKETINLMRATSQANKASKSNIDKIAISKAQKNFTAKTGQVMTPSRLKAGMSLNIKEARDYNKDKSAIKKATMKKYGF